MLRSTIITLSLSLFTVAGLACDPAPTSPTMSREQELAATLLEQSPDIAVLSLDDERLVAVDDEGECLGVDDALYCIAGGDAPVPDALGLTTPEPDPVALINQDCIYVDGFLYCNGGGGGGGGCYDFDCGPCLRRASSYTGWAEWCGCAGWVACYPEDAP